MAKKTLLVVSCVIAGFVGAHLLVPAWLQWRGDAFATDAVDAMSERWDAQELDSRAHPAMLEMLRNSKQTSAQYFQIMSRMGKRSSTDCNAVTFALFTLPQSSVSAVYRCDMSFDTGPAALTMEIRKDGLTGDWKIATMNVDSGVFKEAAPAPRSQPQPQPQPPQGDEL